MSVMFSKPGTENTSTINPKGMAMIANERPNMFIILKDLGNSLLCPMWANASAAKSARELDFSMFSLALNKLNAGSRRSEVGVI